MPQADRIFKRAFRKHFSNHEANFPPSKEIALGDYGIFRNGYFEKLGNIQDAPFSIKFKAKPDNAPTSEEFQSEGKVSVKNIAKGELINGVPAAKAAIDIGFNASSALYFSSAKVTYLQIDNLYEIGSKVIKAYKEKKWKKNFVLVSRILQGANTVIVISGSAACSVTIEAESPRVEKINLSDTKASLQFSRSNEVSYKVISRENCAIGFGISKVYNPLFNGPSFKKFRSAPEIFNELDLDSSIDKGNLVFGDVLPQNYDSGTA
jgi:hypothetical protein